LAVVEQHQRQMDQMRLRHLGLIQFFPQSHLPVAVVET